MRSRNIEIVLHNPGTTQFSGMGILYMLIVLTTTVVQDGRRLMYPEFVVTIWGTYFPSQSWVHGVISDVTSDLCSL